MNATLKVVCGFRKGDSRRIKWLTWSRNLGKGEKVRTNAPSCVVQTEVNGEEGIMILTKMSKIYVVISPLRRKSHAFNLL